MQNIRALVVTFAFLFSSSPSESTTFVMLLLHGDRVIIAADGRQTVTRQSGRKEYRETCKIRPVKDVEIVMDSLVRHVPTGLMQRRTRGPCFRCTGLSNSESES
jgi:hypothetical protein